MTLHIGDCREVMMGMTDCSVDSIITDPPAGINFMNMSFDHHKGGRNQWIAWLAGVMEECHRVLKPGGHALVWALPRTSHWTATAVEDAGFEIRDCILYHGFGQGFPKGMRIDNALIKENRKCLSNANAPYVEQVSSYIHLQSAEGMELTALASARIQPEGAPALLMEIGGVGDSSGLMAISLSEPQMEHIASNTTLSWSALSGVDFDLMKTSTIATEAEITTIRKILKSFRLPTMLDCIMPDVTLPNGQQWIACTVINLLSDKSHGLCAIPVLTALGSASTNPARRYEGFNVALKPAYEHWILARKPLAKGKTVAANVLEWGTGGINVDACRIGETGGTRGMDFSKRYTNGIYQSGMVGDCGIEDIGKGRWPPNVALSCCGNDPHDPDCAAAMLDAQSGERKSNPVAAKGKQPKAYTHKVEGWGNFGVNRQPYDYTETDTYYGASRFFYVAKASRAERNRGLEGMEERSNDWQRATSGLSQGKNPRTGERTGVTMGPRANFHPTVKPMALMRWLVRMVTPPGGVVLDPFMGSGTTGIAAFLEGFDFIGIEQDAEYLDIARARIAHAQQQGRQVAFAVA